MAARRAQRTPGAVGGRWAGEAALRGRHRVMHAQWCASGCALLLRPQPLEAPNLPVQTAALPVVASSLVVSAIGLALPYTPVGRIEHMVPLPPRRGSHFSPCWFWQCAPFAPGLMRCLPVVLLLACFPAPL